jgi:hypothetical protein
MLVCSYYFDLPFHKNKAEHWSSLTKFQLSLQIKKRIVHIVISEH